MLSLLILVIILGIILEAVSLKRDPANVELDYALSESAAEPGVPFKVQVIVTNRSRIPVSYLAIREVFPSSSELPDGIVFRVQYDGFHIENICRLNGRQRKRLILETSIKKRGVHTFRGDSIEFGDFLGFRETIKNVTNHQKIVVYPDRIECPNLADAITNFYGDIAAKRCLIRDPILTIGSREYTGREPMKDINWLQSARRGELMVREFEYNRQLSVNVILSVDEIGILDEEGLDKCCAIARTVCEKLVDKGVPVRFYTNALLRDKGKKEIWKCEVSSGHSGGLLEALGRVTNRACSSLEKLLEHTIRESDSGAAFVVILPESAKHGEEIIDKLRRVTCQEILLLRAGMPATARHEEEAV